MTPITRLSGGGVAVELGGDGLALGLRRCGPAHWAWHWVSHGASFTSGYPGIDIIVYRFPACAM